MNTKKEEKHEGTQQEHAFVILLLFLCFTAHTLHKTKPTISSHALGVDRQKNNNPSHVTRTQSQMIDKLVTKTMKERERERRKKDRGHPAQQSKKQKTNKK